MGYLDDNPEFQHQLLVVRDDALWLVPDEHGGWTLPGFVSDEQHTAEVGLIARHVRERFGVGVVILGRAATEFDASANRVYKADLAELLVDAEPNAGPVASDARVCPPGIRRSHLMPLRRCS